MLMLDTRHDGRQGLFPESGHSLPKCFRSWVSCLRQPPLCKAWRRFHRNRRMERLEDVIAVINMGKNGLKQFHLRGEDRSGVEDWLSIFRQFSAAHVFQGIEDGNKRRGDAQERNGVNRLRMAQSVVAMLKHRIMKHLRLKDVHHGRTEISA